MANSLQKPTLFRKVEAICITFICFVLFSCEKPQVQKQEKGYPLADIIQEKSYWEGSSVEASDMFFMDDENMFCLQETKRPYTGVIKVRSRNGTVAALRSYISGVPDGDFYEWHENGNLKSKQQYKNGVKHGYFFVWTSNNVIYSRRYYQVPSAYPFHRHYHMDEPFLRDIAFVTKTIRLLATKTEAGFSYDAKEVRNSMRQKYEIK